MALTLRLAHLRCVVLETYLVAQNGQIHSMLDLLQRLEFIDIVLGVESTCPCVSQRGICILVHIIS